MSTSSLWTRASATGITVGLMVGLGVSMLGQVGAPQAAQADSSSAVTVAAKGYDLDYADAPMPDLKVTVSQTTNLTSQGIVVSWTGGKKSTRPQGLDQGQNFVQIAECWGEDPNNPGHPDRTTCQYGAFPNGGRDSTVDANSVDSPKNIAPQDAQYTSASTSYFNPPYTSIPFRSVTGVTVANVLPDANGVNRHDSTVDVNNNQFFTAYTSNEVKWAGSDSTGTGSAKFEVQTSLQSQGLGCGQPIVVTGQPVVGQSCWLVVVPRGTSDSGQSYVTKPGLFWDAWQHHIAFKLSFEPVGVHCAIGSAEKQLSGSELAFGAISSWQPNLCKGTTGSAFVMSTGSESDAVTAASTTTPSPLALTARPLQTANTDPMVYAPIAISAVTVPFNIDRLVTPVGTVPQVYKDKTALPFTALNLTPRLVAKLLTASYIDSLPGGTSRAEIGYTDLAHPGPNAHNLTKDPDFLKVNDVEWQYQNLSSPAIADALMPNGRSDLAVQLWRYIMADPDGAAFMNGDPDPWGMKINPWFSTNPAVNPTKTGMTLPRDNFPKADPIESPAQTGFSTAGPVDLVTWRPYTSSFDTGAYQTLRADGQVLGAWDASKTPPAYGKSQRDLIGDEKVIALSTAASSARYQTINASLMNSAGNFVSPTSDAMLAAAAAMTATSTQPKVLEYDPAGASAKAAATSYPLTMPVYAALNPLQTDATLRAAYAGLIRYAATDGQVEGTALGQLPLGYAPIPKAWSDQSLVAATAIEQGISQLAVTPAAAATSSTASVPAASSYVGSSVSGTDAVAAVAAAVAAAPAATGSTAGPLLGQSTPADPAIGPAASAVPAGILSGLAAAGGFPLFLRFRRRL